MLQHPNGSVSRSTRRGIKMSVSFGPGASGAGGAAGNGFIGTIGASWTHTATGNFVIVGFSQFCSGQSPSGQTFTCTYDGVAMTPLARIDWDIAASMSLYYMFNPPGGAKTVACSAGNGGNTGRTIEGNSVSYSGVGGVMMAGSLTSTAGGVATLSGLSASGNDKLFFSTVGWGGVSSPTYTERANAFNGTFPAQGISLGDLPGTATTASASPNNNPYSSWGIAAVRLLTADSFSLMF